MKQLSRKRQQGITLFLTMVILIILATLIVQFQAESALQLRASNYRIDMQRCRYAAESGLVVAQVMVAEHYENIARIHRSFRAGEELEEDAVISGWNRFSDPNATWAERLAYDTGITERQAITVGDIPVLVEVQDENAKYPVLWLLRSPFASSGGRDVPERSVEHFGELLDMDSAIVNDTIRLVQEIAEPLPLPAAEVTVQAPDQAEGRRRRRHLGLTAVMEENRERHRLMAVFANAWYTELFHNLEYAELIEPLAENVEPFPVLLGVWGAGKININTASPELLESAFAPVGITEHMVQSIVDYRIERPFGSMAELRDIDLSGEVRQYMRELCVTASDTFSLHITASLGRTRCEIISGVYRNRRGEILNMGILTR
ncbi:MAG: general secretion pathway protein GspK [Sedimentisphaerales bacterium]|nr:general secretion pathway protein GspK [Sedimentisphaerales bacterium]